MKGDFDPRITKRYWNHKELAEGLHLSRAHLYRLLEEGHMLGPDVVVAADNLGWDPKRALRFGADTDRLDADGRPIGPQPDGGLVKARDLIKTRYGARPRVYLSSWLTSYVYGLDKSTVFFMRKRDTFIPADVLVGRKFGWSEERIIEYGEQTGRLDDRKIDAWLLRRSEEFGLSPDIAWVERRVKERPLLTRPLERAVEAWRASQTEAAGA